MSTPQWRPIRHTPEPGKLRSLTSFLTCRIASTRTTTPECSHVASSREISAHTANERASIYHPRSVSTATRGGSMCVKAGLSEFRTRLSATLAPDRFPAGIDAELFSFHDVATGHGIPPALLRHPRVADEAQRCLHALDGVLCTLDAFVILPTQVHLLFTQQFSLLEGPTPDQVSAVFKITVERHANQHLDRIGTFWDAEDFHRYLRTDGERRAARDFIFHAPVRGGLVEKPGEWEWLYLREDAARTP